MATSGSCTDPYSGRTSFNGYLYVRRDAVSGTKAKWAWELRARNPNGSSSTFVADPMPGTVVVAGQSFPISHNLDFRGGQAYITLGSGVTGWIEQGGGTPKITFSFSHGPASIFGTAAASGSFVADRLASVPSQPGTPTVSQITSTSMRLAWAIPSNGGAAIDKMLLRRSSTLDFASYVDYPLGATATFLVVTGLTPATDYYWRVYAHNVVGYSSPSGTRSTRTTSGFRVGKGGTFPHADAKVGAGGTFTTPQVLIGKGGSFVSPA